MTARLAGGIAGSVTANIVGAISGGAIYCIGAEFPRMFFVGAFAIETP